MAWEYGIGVLLDDLTDGASSGDVILIGTDTPIDEQVTIRDKSLSVLAADGHHPTVVRGMRISGTTGSVAVSIAGLSVS